MVLIWQVRTPLQTMLETYPVLRVCRADAEGLINAMSVYEKEAISPDAMQSDLNALDIWRASSVVEKAKKLEGVALAELQILDVYHASQKGIYSTSDLIERADYTLPESIRAKIPAEAVEELRQSGRCLAFDRFTASGFHMMRAAEAVLYEYYVSICKPTTKKKLDNWGAYILALRKWQDEKDGNKSPDVEKVIAVLQQIKDQDRNLIMHPELVLSGDDAFTLFEVGQGAIIAMAARLKPKAPRKPSRSKVVGTGGALKV